MTRFLDHVVRSARTANAGLEAAERRSPPPAADARAQHDDTAADATQITADDPAARQITRDELRAQAPAQRPVEVSGVRADLAARPSPADERAAERARASLTPRRAQTELLAGAWIAAGSHTPGPTSPAGARATAEAARSTALASATITDAGRRPPARDPQQPVPVAAPASPPAAPRTQAAPAIPAPRMAAPQSPTPPARELHIEHLDVRVIQEPPPRAAVRPPSPASNATARGAWRPAARRFLKQP